MRGASLFLPIGQQRMIEAGAVPNAVAGEREMQARATMTRRPLLLVADLPMPAEAAGEGFRVVINSARRVVRFHDTSDAGFLSGGLFRIQLDPLGQDLFGILVDHDVKAAIDPERRHADM